MASNIAGESTEVGEALETLDLDKTLDTSKDLEKQQDEKDTSNVNNNGEEHSAEEESSNIKHCNNTPTVESTDKTNIDSKEKLSFIDMSVQSNDTASDTQNIPPGENSVTDSEVETSSSHSNTKPAGVSEDDEEDEFQACDESGSSGSDDEYESADEGEEIKTDALALEQLEESLTEEEKETRRQSAQQMKQEGNTLFTGGSYKGAIKMYSRALRTCPLKFVKERAILYSNRSACKMKLTEDESAIKDCSKAIELHPEYLKPLLRRAELNEKTDKLEEALADHQKILELDPSQHASRAACMKLPGQIKERNEKLKEEMMGKLKDLGNMILRPFGLSTNNFQMNQDPNTGGYSVNFNQNPGDNGK